MRSQISNLINSIIAEQVPNMLKDHLSYHPMALAYDFMSGEDYSNQTCKIILPATDYTYANGSTPESPRQDYTGHIISEAQLGDVTNAYWMDVIHESRATMNPNLSKEEASDLLTLRLRELKEMGVPLDAVRNFRDYFVKVPFQATLVHGLTVGDKFHVLGPTHQLFSDINSFSQSDSQPSNALPPGNSGNAPSAALRSHGNLKDRWQKFISSSLDTSRPKHSDGRGRAWKDGNAEITMKEDVVGISVDDGVSFHLNRTGKHLVLQAKTIDLIAENIRWNGAPLNDNLVSFEDVEGENGEHVPSRYNDGKITRHEFMARQEAIEGAKIDLHLLPESAEYKVMGPLMGGKFGVRLNSIVQGIGHLAEGAYDDITKHLDDTYNQQLKDGGFVKDSRWGGSDRMTTSPVSSDSSDPAQPEKGPDLMKVKNWSIFLDHGKPHGTILSAFKHIREKFLDHKHLSHATGEHHIREGEMRSYPFQEIFKSRLVEIGRIIIQNTSMLTAEFSDPIVDKDTNI